MAGFITDEAKKWISDTIVEFETSKDPIWSHLFAVAPDFACVVLFIQNCLTEELFENLGCRGDYLKEFEDIKNSIKQDTSLENIFLQLQALSLLIIRLYLICDNTLLKNTALLGVQGAIKCFYAGINNTFDNTLDDSEITENDDLIKSCFTEIEKLSTVPDFAEKDYISILSDFLLEKILLSVIPLTFVALYAFDYENFRQCVKASFKAHGYDIEI